MAMNTSSEDAYRKYRKFQDRWALRYSGDGYSVDFVSHSAVRYREDSHSITFSSEPLSRISVDGKTQLVLTVYVHYPLRWDNPDGTEIQDREQERTILSRLETALKEQIGDYEITPLAV